MTKVVVEFESGSRATFYPKHERVVFEFATFEGVRSVDLSFDEALRVMKDVKAAREQEKAER